MFVVVFSDDHFSAIGISQALKGDRTIRVEAHDRADLADLHIDSRPTCIVIDCGDSSPEAARAVFAWGQELRTPVLVMFDRHREMWKRTAQDLGASAVLLRSGARNELLPAVTALSAGEEWSAPPPADVTNVPQLSAREVQCLSLYCDGFALREIALRMHVTQSTVQTYLARIRAKYADAGRPARSRLQLRAEAVADGRIERT